MAYCQRNTNCGSTNCCETKSVDTDSIPNLDDSDACCHDDSLSQPYLDVTLQRFLENIDAGRARELLKQSKNSIDLNLATILYILNDVCHSCSGGYNYVNIYDKLTDSQVELLQDRGFSIGEPETTEDCGGQVHTYRRVSW